MSCPAGQFYSETAKQCLPLKMKPLSRGKSLVPCPAGQVWNPEPNVRRCVRKDIYKALYGADKAGVASLKQRALVAVVNKTLKKMSKSKGKTKNKNKSNAKKASVKVVSLTKRAITPALKETVEITSSAPRKNSVMAPGLSRDRMGEWVSSFCKNQEDPIMMEPYAEADLRDLRSLVRLGSGFCYTADVLDQHVRSSVERGVSVKDMMNPAYRLDAADYGALKKAASTLQKSYSLPSLPSEKPAAHYKLFIGVAGDPAFKLVFLFDERKVKKLPGGGQEFTNAIPDGGWIGYIPSAGTDVLEKLIKEAFKRGRVFTKAERPFLCCRFHLKKDKAYWADRVESKIKAMEEEISGLL